MSLLGVVDNLNEPRKLITTAPTGFMIWFVEIKLLSTEKLDGKCANSDTTLRVGLRCKGVNNPLVVVLFSIGLMDPSCDWLERW